MRENHDGHTGKVGLGLLLDDGLDADRVHCEYPGDIGQHAGPVQNMDAQVIGRGNLVHGKYRNIGQGIRLECQVRHAVLGVRGECANHIHQVRHDGGPGRLGACTRAIVQAGSQGICLDHHGIHHAVHVCDQAPLRDQGRVYTQFKTPVRAPCDPQVLDPVAEFRGIGNILAGDLGNPFGVDLVQLQRHTESHRGQDRELVRGIGTLDVESRVGLGIPQPLRILERGIEIPAPVSHFGQYEIAGAVDDPGQPLDGIGGKPLTQGLDDGDAAGHGRFKSHGHPLLLCTLKNFIAVVCNQRLVGRHHMLAVINGLEHQLPGLLRTAHQLQHDVYVRIADHLVCILGQGQRGDVTGTRLFHIAYTRHGNPDTAARPACNFIRIARQDACRPGTYRTQAQYTDFYSFQHVLTLTSGSFQHLANASHSLPGPMLVFNQAEAHVGIAVLAEPDPRRYGHMGLLQHSFRELQ